MQVITNLWCLVCECEVCLDGMQLEYVPELKHLGCVSDESCVV